MVRQGKFDKFITCECVNTEWIKMEVTNQNAPIVKVGGFTLVKMGCAFAELSVTGNN